MQMEAQKGRWEKEREYSLQEILKHTQPQPVRQQAIAPIASTPTQNRAAGHDVGYNTSINSSFTSINNAMPAVTAVINRQMQSLSLPVAAKTNAPRSRIADD